ncbi:hypothetical protein BN424_507 [Carnobacterium maltaromaticum LMA28]|uniref:Uncharacterized protein n=1 Tax=Carnobacterium maltaromaticum LMA28 TaxID=1234679 RepID=K8E208_CARML|nr:hypothetical protein BN424_507 [Carnobacterium maltaromaticum LMA28]
MSCLAPTEKVAKKALALYQIPIKGLIKDERDRYRVVLPPFICLFFTK